MAATIGLHSVAELIQAGDRLAADAKTTFGQLNPAQINWKPSPDTWSVGQCFDHLITTNRTYFPSLEALLAGTRKPNIWEKMGLFSEKIGPWLLNSLVEGSTKKFTAPPAFQPSMSTMDGNIIQSFINEQKVLLDFMKKTEKFDLNRIIISSPAAKPMTYSLMNAYRVLIVHEQRHYRQALRVTESPGFPTQ